MNHGGKTVFGKRKQDHILILANGDHIKHMAIKPWMFAMTVGFITIMIIGYLVATTYLIVRDDLIGAYIAHRARLQHSYEDQIANLRIELDRMTSEQLLNRRFINNKVTELVKRQEILSSRHGQLSPVLQQTSALKKKPDSVSMPSIHTGSILTSFAPRRSHSQFSTSGIPVPFTPANPKKQIKRAIDKNDTRFFNKTSIIFDTITQSLGNIEKEQISHVQTLTENTNRKTTQITQILKGLTVPTPNLENPDTDNRTGIGGPYISHENSTPFDSSMQNLNKAMKGLDKLLDHVKNLPLKGPVIEGKISSPYGTRRDPFLKRNAFHSGIDFKARTGTNIFPSAKGKVILAGQKGGYGKMIQIDHGNGIVTYYAHLSRIRVKTGQYVTPEMIIGHAGSTGRSTGPHLHYEIRQNGKPVNPIKFLNAGYKLAPFLKKT